MLEYISSFESHTFIFIHVSETTTTKLISPCGGQLVGLAASSETRDDLLSRAKELPSLQLSERALCDLELLATGAFSPLDRFMTSADHARVVGEMRLANGQLFPIPITLPLGKDDRLNPGSEISLRDSRNEIVATMNVEDVYEWDLEETAQAVFGTVDLRHPLVAEMHRWGDRFASGPLQVLQLPARYDFRELRFTPAQTREQLEQFGFNNVVAFQTRNPLHRAHEND